MLSIQHQFAFGQKSNDELIDSLFSSDEFRMGVAKFIEEIGGVDTSYLTVTRIDTFLFGRLPEIFLEHGGADVFICYEELVMDFFHKDFYPMPKEDVYGYYVNNLLKIEFDRIDTKVRVRPIDGNIYELYSFVKNEKVFRTIEIIYVKGLQILGWEDIMWDE